MTKISIIIPVYNAEKHLDMCVDSIVNQTYKNIEIILVNDASADGTWDKILELENRYEENVIAINLCTSSIFTFPSFERLIIK